MIASTSGSSLEAFITRHIKTAFRLFAAVLLMGGASTALAGSYSCGPYPTDNFQVLDGNNPPPGFDPATMSSLSFSGDCTIKNFPQSMGGFGQSTSLLNFNLPGKSAVLILDNVYYTGKMACSNLPPGVVIWWVNGSWNNISPQCQAFIPPMDGIHKLNPVGPTTQAIGIPFTYTLTLPEMVTLNPDGTYTWTGLPDTATVVNASIHEDLTKVGTSANLTYAGADLTYVSNTVYVISGGKRLAAGSLNVTTTDNKILDFLPSNNPLLANIPPGTKIEIDLKVVLDGSAGNVPGTQFANTANWTLTKLVTNQDGSTTQITNVPGMDGVTPPMTIVGPNLVMTKSGPVTTTGGLNLGQWGDYVLDIRNINNDGTLTNLGDAWDATIQDILPHGPTGGMCDMTPQITSAQVFAADGITPVSAPLVNGTDYTFSYTGPTGSPTACMLTLSMKTAASKIGPGQHLKIKYQTKLDANSINNGVVLTNVAGATQWFNGNNYDTDPSTNPVTRTCTLTNGTVGTTDCQDAWNTTVTLSGVYFEKTVQNLVTGKYPTNTAAPGNKLRYTLRLYSIDKQYTGVSFYDDLGALNPTAEFAPGTLSNVQIIGTTGTDNSNPTGGTNGAGILDVRNLTVQAGSEIKVTFDITLASNLANGNVVTNQASLFQGATKITVSDDPNVNGQADPAVAGDEDPTKILIQMPNPPLKAIVPAKSTAAIGDTVTYQITVPGAPYTVDTLNNVVVNDTLDPSLVFVSATDGTTNYINTSTVPGQVSLPIGTINAGQQVVITLVAKVANLAGVGADSADTHKAFTNAASFTYTGGDSGPGAATPAITIIEPKLTATKTARNVTAAKAPTDPAMAGDTLEYTVTLSNSTGTSTAFDTNIVDTLPVNETLVAGSATALINGTAVVGFNPVPMNVSNTLTWGRLNGDGTLDIPAGQPLVLTYRVTVGVVNGMPLDNTINADYTSQDGTPSGERTGANCPSWTAPNDYCTSATASYPTPDPTTIVKSVISDTWNSDGSTGADSILRVGDTVDYRLTLTLREGQLQNAVVTDTLPAGLAFDSVVSINGDTSAPFSATAPFSYADFTAPAISGSTVTWNLGTITNAINYNTADDTFVIVYRARVVSTLAQAATTPQTNNVKLSYTGGDPAVNTKLNSTATITVNQPIISSITKTGTVVGPAGAGNGTQASPYVVNIVNNTMNFQIQAQNTGLAPAYGVVITDTLASQLNEQGITITSVTIGGTPATPGTDYVYTPPAARGGTMSFTLIKPLLQGATVIINYNIGFHDDVAPNQTWNNSATIGKYWSLPPGNVREYISTAPVAPSKVYMTNTFVPVAPAKVVVTPATSEAAVGDTVTYEITVPATPVNAALNNVTITDLLDSRLQYLSATQVSGPAVTNNSVAPTNVSFTLAQLPAGQQVKIRVSARLLNIAATQAESGGTIQNVVSYNYTGAATPLTSLPAVVTIVEPLVAITKAVTIPATPNAPNAGDELTYTVNLTASSGAQYSNAYDLVLADTLGTGLTYVPGSSMVNGVAVADPSIAGQTLTWPARDIAEGAAVNVTYKAKLSDTVTAGQTLCNNASTNWTSLTGLSAYERNGSGTPAFNDYSAKAAPVCVTVNDPTALTKAYVSDTYNDATSSVRVGDLVDYELRLTLQEGTTAGVVVTDVLPAGMAYDSLVGITPASGSSNFTYTVAAQPAAGATTLTWNLGTVVNKGDNIATNDILVIKYRVRVLNNSALLPQTPTTKALTNNATLNYTINGAPATPKTSFQTINALQPQLTMTKGLVSTSGGDTVIDANEVIVYKVDIVNSGAAPAYDTVLTDTLPAGLRQGGVTTTAITLAGAPLPILAPTFNAATGVATWNFDTGVANAYTIPAGQTLHLEYTVKADATLGAGLTLKNSALVPLYYSFDNNDIPSGNVNNRQVYGPTPTSSVTLTTPTPGVLAKATTQPSAAIGQQFKYRITVPAVPVGIALHDVRILDDLGLSAANMRFVSASVVSGGTWTLTNTSGSSTNLVLEDTATGIDIPANGQAVIDVTVELLNTSTNDALSSTSGTFFNTASYTYNQLPNDSTTRVTTLPASSGTMTITRPDLTLTKTAATPSMRVGTPNVFTLTVNNRGTGRAWDVTVTDILPNPTPGGMCSVAPTINGSVQITGGSGTRTLVYGTDYTTGFVTGATNCTYTFIGQSAAAALDPNESLVINYNAELDPDNGNGVALTNYAGATQWFSQDTSGTGATGQTHTYTGLLTDGTPGTLDNQDKFTVLTASPTLSVTKTVFHADSTPAPTAKPGETLHYVVTVTNTSDVPLPNFSLVDDIGLLNSTAVFVSGSLANVTVIGSTADLSHDSPTGGKNGAGLLDIRNLALGKQTDPNKTITVAFDVTLAPVITNAVVVYNQAQVVSYGFTIAVSDDPAVSGATNPTQTVIGSNPVMQVLKTAQDLTGDPAVLMAGDTLRYTITVKNIGTENATNVSLRDALPANTTYIANSTRLNGTVVSDASPSVSALQAGFLIHAPAPEDTTPGFMRADPSATTANVAMITFDVMVNADTLDGTLISNQGFVNGSGTSGNIFPQKPSDDPSTPAMDDPTVKTVLKPNGVVYNSISRQPIAGVQLKLLNGSTGLPVSASCFKDPAQQGQVTSASGSYKFDINFSAGDCPPNADYIIQVAAVPKDVVAGPSIFVPQTMTGAYDVRSCANDAIASTTQCEAQVSATAPATSASDTRYYMHLTLGNATVPDDSQIFNNHIPLDPNFAETLAITKTAHLVNVTRGQLVPYTITVENKLPGTLTNMVITDTFPAGFKYVAGSARYAIDGSAAKPAEPLRNGLNLSWQNVTLAPNSKHTIQLLLVVSSGVSEGEYVNRAQALSVISLGNNSRIAAATVRVIPDPTFDCTDIIGKVFDDANRNGYQDPGEKGLPGVRLATVRGLLVTTDKYGRFHITCAITPDENRGSNFVMKVDDRTLPTGYRITTENPLVQRATRGKMMKFNFGATIHKVVRLDMSDGVFEPGKTDLRIQWKPRMDLLIGQLKKGPSVLRLGYMAEVEDEDLVDARLKAVKAEIARQWAEQNSDYKLEIETEVFWRTGTPPERSALK